MTRVLRIVGFPGPKRKMVIRQSGARTVGIQELLATQYSASTAGLARTETSNSSRRQPDFVANYGAAERWQEPCHLPLIRHILFRDRKRPSRPPFETWAALKTLKPHHSEASRRAIPRYHLGDRRISFVFVDQRSTTLQFQCESRSAA